MHDAKLTKQENIQNSTFMWKSSWAINQTVSWTVHYPYIGQIYLPITTQVLKALSMNNIHASWKIVIKCSIIFLRLLFIWSLPSTVYHTWHISVLWSIRQIHVYTLCFNWTKHVYSLNINAENIFLRNIQHSHLPISKLLTVCPAIHDYNHSILYMLLHKIANDTLCNSLTWSFILMT